MRCLMRLHLTCVFVRFADYDTSLFSRVLTVVTYPSLSLPTRRYRYLPVVIVTYPSLSLPTRRYRYLPVVYHFYLGYLVMMSCVYTL